MIDELPEGWGTGAIGEFAEVFLGKTPSRADYASGGKFKIVKFRDLRDGSVDFSNPKAGFVRGDEAVIPGLRRLYENDVLITSAAHSGENIGKKVALVPRLPAEYEKVFFTGELLNIRCTDKVLNRWVYFFFRSPDGFTEIQDSVAGVHLTAGRSKQMVVPLAPLAEQKRIIAKLETLAGKVDASRARLRRIPGLLRRFRRSIITAACSGSLTADWRAATGSDGKWPIRALSVLGDVTGGITKNAKRQAMKLQVPYLRVANVYENRLDLSEVLNIGVTEQELERTRLLRDDLLFVEGNGSLDQIGRVALWGGSIDRCVGDVLGFL